MKKQIAYEIDGQLLSERDARKLLDNKYGDAMLRLADTLAQEGNGSAWKTREALDKHIGEAAGVVRAYNRLQEFEKLVKGQYDDSDD